MLHGECHDISHSTLRATGKKDKKYVLDGCRGPLGHSAHGEPSADINALDIRHYKAIAPYHRCQWRDSHPLDRCVDRHGMGYTVGRLTRPNCRDGTEGST